MKMKKSLVALCLSAGLFASAPGISLADVNIVPQNTTAAPAIPTAALQQLTWTPVDQSKTQSTQLATAGQRLDVAGITGPVAAYSVPANIGELTLTLASEVNKQTSVFAPNVLILDQNMTPSAFFPSSYFTYQEPGVMSADRLEGVMRLTPALGQQKLYVLVFTTDKDLQQTTTLLDPAKAYAKGVGNAIPDIPDPIARHTTDGLLKLKVKTSSSSSVLVGPLFGSSGPGPVTVGNTAAPAVTYAAPAAAVAAPAPQPVKKSEPMLNDTESYFNQGIKDAVAKGDVDKALKLLDEAERLGSKSARSTFISSVKGKG
ncbi:maltose operon protein MalM [Citrobacter freundii complex sp. 2024EL-00228]|jgi:maltose operon protein|uniref:Maltose operon protein MalM n=1 Tax=Citrobacter freundii TaxID=546 RepID=A0A9P3Z9F8_CITFR|nr:maltose operon protein MalM [Citrobacter freundii]EJC8217561.1 maltose operon protein MalM [Citrobacter freundii]ELK7555046.1 maltose operon protein MalM [Citrobacter freundii]MBJ9315617.1 maltose operon protein MalM [Citrobacter freundii]MDH1413255.1 maltose operon protein MalM [Citrobacter freundii]STB12771.1 maltose regulon periplasmic protein [Citrobacter freundii]